MGNAESKAVFDAAGRPPAILQPVPVQLEDHHGDALRRMSQGDHNDAECVLRILPCDSYSSCCAVMKPFSPALWTSRQFSAVSTGIVQHLLQMTRLTRISALRMLAELDALAWIRRHPPRRKERSLVSESKLPSPLWRTTVQSAGFNTCSPTEPIIILERWLQASQ